MTAADRAWLAALLDGHGANPSDWPPASRQRASRLLEEHPAAAVMYREAQHLDGLLRHALAPPETAADRERAQQLSEDIIARLRRRSPLDGLLAALWSGPSPIRFANAFGLLILPLVLGFTAGAMTTASIESELQWSEQMLLTGPLPETDGELP